MELFYTTRNIIHWVYLKNFSLSYALASLLDRTPLMNFTCAEC